MFWEKLKTQIRDDCLAIWNKLELLLSILLTVLFPKTPLLTKVQWIRMEDEAKTILLVRFLFVRKKSFIARFNGKSPALNRSLLFFFHNRLYWPKFSYKHGRCSSNYYYFFFWQRKTIKNQLNGKFPAADLNKIWHLLSWLHNQLYFLFLCFYFVWKK